MSFIMLFHVVLFGTGFKQLFQMVCCCMKEREREREIESEIC